MTNRNLSGRLAMSGGGVGNRGMYVISAMSVNTLVLFGKQIPIQTPRGQLSTLLHDLIVGDNSRGTALVWNQPLHGCGLQ